MQKTIKLLPPMMPNFIRIQMPAGKRDEGLKLPEGIPITGLTEAEAVEYGELMKQTFIEHWRTKTTKI